MTERIQAYSLDDGSQWRIGKTPTQFPFSTLDGDVMAQGRYECVAIDDRGGIYFGVTEGSDGVFIVRVEGSVVARLKRS